MSKKKPKLHSLCTIVRTVKVTHSTLDMVSGETSGGRSEIVTMDCGVPLFNDEHQRTGVCRSCSEGWEVKGNRFANAQERERALKSVKSKSKSKVEPK